MIRKLPFPLLAFACLVGCELPTSGAVATDAGEPIPDSADDSPADGALDAVSDSGNPAVDSLDPTAPPPTLDALSIAGATLSPEFAPTIHDYVVRCGEGSNSLQVTATAPAGTTMQLTSPIVSPLFSEEGMAIDVDENQAIAVQVSSPGGDDSYWIRCLPHDFPALSVNRVRAPAPGYYLLGNTVVGAGESGYAMVLDTHGTPVWYRKTTTGAGYVTVAGTNRIVFSPIMGPTFGIDPTASFSVLDLATGATKSVASSPGPTDHHELVPTADGHFFNISYPRSVGFDLSSRGSATTDIADCRIEDIAPDGSIAWSWLASEHFDVAVESTFIEEGVVDGKGIGDGFHCNSVDVFPGGDLLVSARHMDAVFRVSRATSKVLWKLGGVASNKDGAQILALKNDPTGGFHRQHDARVLSDNEISIFDNHGPAVGPARAMHLAIDTEAASATVTWSYDGPAGSGAMGSHRLLSDGGHVIGWGMIGVSPPIAFTEIDASKSTVIEVTFPGGDRAYRAVKVPESALDLQLLRNGAGKS
jgi:hypothetical protein